MTKNRLEAFSDGVFSIVITLLILDVKIPDREHITNGQLIESLQAALPNVITFIFTFLIVGVFWVAHHRIFGLVRVVDPKLLWLNIFYLMFIVLIPFPASILARHPLLQVSILIYSTTLLLVGFFHFIFIRYLYKHPELHEEGLSKHVFKQAIKVTAIGPCCYLLAILISFFNVYVSFGPILVPFVYFVFFAGSLRPVDKPKHRKAQVILD